MTCRDYYNRIKVSFGLAKAKMSDAQAMYTHFEKAHKGETTGSFRMNENLYLLIFQGLCALLELRQVAKFYLCQNIFKSSIDELENLLIL